MTRIKPRIRRVFSITTKQWEWVCSDTSDCYAYGWGATRELAYEHWLAHFAPCFRARREQ